MVMAFVSCCYFSSHCIVLCRRLEQIRCGHENSSEHSNWAIDNLVIRSVMSSVFRHYYSFPVGYFWRRWNTFSSPSGNKNWCYAHIFILWLVTPHWKKPSALSPTLSYYVPLLHALIRGDYLLQAWRANAGMERITFFWDLPYFLLPRWPAGSK